MMINLQEAKLSRVLSTMTRLDPGTTTPPFIPLSLASCLPSSPLSSLTLSLCSYSILSPGVATSPVTGKVAPTARHATPTHSTRRAGVINILVESLYAVECIQSYLLGVGGCIGDAGN